MQQYSPKNQEWIKRQLPTATECRSMHQWNQLGFRVIKGTKALKIASPSGLRNTFDVSQVEPAPQNTGKQARRVSGNLAEARAIAEYDAYSDALTNGLDMDFTQWLDVQRSAALATD